MNATNAVLGFVLVLVALYLGRSEWKRRERETFRRSYDHSANTLHELRKEHAKEFNQKEILKITESIYMAIGYALANSIMVIGKDGVIIIDVTESYEAASEIFAEFRKITKKPVTDIIYTHNHADHTYGAMGFVEDGAPMPNVWAHASITKALRGSFNGPRTAHFVRSMRQFGVYLPNHVSSGIGHKLDFGTGERTVAMIYPTKFFDGDELETELAGVPLKLVHIPGETDDTIGVWLPDQKAFMCADDLYRAFPNLYAIRGTPTRALMQWVESLDKIIDIEPEILVPSHTRPVIGREPLMLLLTQYRDAIQYVHDQSLRLITYGYHPDEIANKVKLPEVLQSNPHLGEFYGTVKWSAKSVSIGYQGWFSGDPVELDPLTRGERADKMVELVGAEKMVTVARKALEDNDFQWALELSAHVLRNDASNTDARDIKVQALTELGSRQKSVNGYNYYLTAAMETATDLKFSTPKQAKSAFVKEFPIQYALSAFPSMYKSEDCETRNETLYFALSDPESHHHIQLRNGVAIVRNKVPKHWDIKVTTQVDVLKDVLSQSRTALVAIAKGDITVDGGTLAFKSFMDCFDTEAEYSDL